jgi:hypothetical protein
VKPLFIWRRCKKLKYKITTNANRIKRRRYFYEKNETKREIYMDDILDYIAGILQANEEWPVLLGLAADAPDDVIIITQYDAPPPILVFGGVFHIYGVKVSARSRDVNAARVAMRKIEDALRQNPRGEYHITPTASIIYAGQDEKQRHVYTAKYKVNEMQEF